MTESEKQKMREALARVDAAAEGDSNDEEIDALRDALDTSLELLGWQD
jgi:hypothetical protein